MDIQTEFVKIDQCPFHQERMDPDCQRCGAEFTAKSAFLDQINSEAAKQMKDIRTEGIGAINQITILGIRLELLIESVLQDRSRLHYEIEVGRRVLEQINEVRTAYHRMRLVGKKSDLHVVHRK